MKFTLLILCWSGVGFLVFLNKVQTRKHSVLEIPACGRKVKTTSTCVSLNSSSASEISFTRTDMECLSACNDQLLRCSAAFRSQSDGMCYMMNDSESLRIENCSNDVAGTLIQIIGKSDNGSCGDRQCEDSQICVNECHKEPLSEPFCLADDRKNCKEIMQLSNALHYWNSEASTNEDSGTVWSVTYPKLNRNTGLRIIQYIDMRSSYFVANGCQRWYITFDGSECASPETIELVDYTLDSVYFHQTSNIDGTCWGITKNDVLIETVTAPCAGYSSNPKTGYDSSSSTIIMEVLQMPDAREEEEGNNCPSSISFNYQYYTWNEEFDITFDTTNHNQLIKSVLYTKKASDTSLRLKYNALMAVKILSSSNYYCGRWFLTINGTECDPHVDGIIHQVQSPDHWDHWKHHTRLRAIEGICDNVVGTGVLSVEIWVGNCINITGTSQPTNFISGGFNSPSRIIIEEVRKNEKVEALYGHDLRMYKSMYGSISHWQWYGLNSDVVDGVILTVTYYKQFADTGLRLTASGTHTISDRYTARWYFEIDGSGCANPGKIEALAYMYHGSKTHQPMQTSGVCHEVSTGNHTITYVTGDDNADAPATGWFASFHVFVEEIRFDGVKECSTSIPVNCDA